MPLLLVKEMLKANKTIMPKTNRSVRYLIAQAVAMTLFIAAAVLIIPSCQRKPVMSHASFIHLPASGWQRTLPLTFIPAYDDSAASYDIKLALRHASSYRYRNLSLVVDIIGADSTVNRQSVDVALADEYGNWTGGGFGALYQDQVIIAQGVGPDAARSIVVWQAMQGCDTLHGINDLGITTIPMKKGH